MDGAAATLVSGVERGEQLDDLGAADLTHDQAIRPHAQCLAHQIAHRHGPGALDVGRATLKADQVRMVGTQRAGREIAHLIQAARPHEGP